MMAVPRIQSGLMSQKICFSEKRHQSVKTFVLICFNLKLECIFIFCVKILISLKSLSLEVFAKIKFLQNGMKKARLVL